MLSELFFIVILNVFHAEWRFYIALLNIFKPSVFYADEHSVKPNVIKLSVLYAQRVLIVWLNVVMLSVFYAELCVLYCYVQ
jgi:hypothetical protein